MEKTGFFEEKPGAKSMMRLNSFILIWFFGIFNILYFLGQNTINYEFIMYDFVLLIGIFVPKYLQKIAENKIIQK